MVGTHAFASFLLRLMIKTTLKTDTRFLILRVADPEPQAEH